MASYLLLLVAPALTSAAFVARPASPCFLRRTSSSSSGAAVQLLAPPSTGASALFEADAAALVSSTMALAKTEADELLEEVFINLPTAVVGLLLAFFVVQYVKSFEPDSDGVLGILFKDYFLFLAAPIFSVLFVLAGKLGLLGAVSGALAKVSLDGWNVFANIALPGAILKY
mmetsp:Transcript_6616/g.15346  ORF Transcript_6616/g.15346 Transcript_6616/m.15346 type:complete len:172 (-) Transcript_6616:236-751(-)